MTFIDKLLPKIFYHRNMLPHYRKTIKPLTDALNAAYMDIDFTENLTVPLKYETQSLHWAQESKSLFIQVLSKSTTQRVIIPIFQTPKYMTTFSLKLQWMKCPAKSIIWIH